MVDKALQDVEQISKELLDLADSGKKIVLIFFHA